ncbi:hypothetical protein [Deinococcus hopiensis]|uniref:hypothetical protein n=1 Tax=Deinococcus hopiensis TaxID=309885 RepID=UPI00111BF01D|nr:hypothetical protein [Deinococcus hopiensis]
MLQFPNPFQRLAVALHRPVPAAPAVQASVVVREQAQQLGMLLHAQRPIDFDDVMRALGCEG